MITAKKMSMLGAIACAMLAVPAAQAADDTFVNPEWANSAWYIGAGLGQSQATIDRARLERSLTANGAAMTSFGVDEKDVGYKLFVGKQLNQYVAVEAGYFDLGKFSFNSTTSQGGTLSGEAGFRGVNLDLLGQIPLSQRFSVYGRLGMNYAEAKTHFRGNRLFAVTNANPSEKKVNPKAGLGLEFKFSEALALRGEAERHRVNDAVGNRGDVDLFSLSLVYKLGRPVARPAPAPEPAPAPAPVAEAPMPAPAPAPLPTPAPAPQSVSEKVSFAAEALFDFDSAVVKQQGKLALDDLLGKMQGMNTEVIVTVGHTDSIGKEAYNLKLSQRRAEAVKAYIISKGIDQARVYTEGKGETQPVGDNKTSAGRAQNRRVTVEVVGTRSK